MSGCCGQGPVIISGGAAATPRVDVEAVLLCDVLADGAVAATVLVEPIYDTSSGARIGTRIVDPSTGADYVPTGVLGPCSANGPCRDNAVLLLCDTTGEGTVIGPPTSAVAALTDVQQTYPAGYEYQQEPNSTEAFASQTALFGNESLTGRVYRRATATLTATDQPCPESVPTVTATFHVRLGGTVPVVGDPGQFRLMDGAVPSSDYSEPGATVVTSAAPPADTPVGWEGDLTVTGPVDPAALAAGQVFLDLALNTADSSQAPGATPLWIIESFSYSAEWSGCPTASGSVVTPFLRHITTDCETGTVTATVDTAMDGTTPYTATGTVGQCPAASGCEQPTTPTATVGLCLADGSPIAVTVVRDCAGAVTSEGWLNLTTGAYSAGAPPTGTMACGDARTITVSGTFCDVDGATGDVLGLVLVEYTYDDTGAISAVRLVDAVTGGTYTPTGTVTVCPAGVEQPDQDLVLLCDIASDGTATPFVRDYRRDENGAIVGYTDYAPDGAAYAPTGTVGVCGPDVCTNTTSVLLCDAPADSTVTVMPTITDGTPADVAQTQFQALPGPYTSLWSGGSLAFPADPGPAQSHRMAVGQLLANPAGCDGASGTLTVSVRVTQNGPGTGQLWDGALRLFRGTTLLGDDPVMLYAPPGHVQTLTLSTPITAADLAAGDIRVALALETFHGTPKAWTADQFTATVELEGCDVTAATQFLRHIVTDCQTGAVVSQTDTTLDGDPYTVTGDVAQCQPVTAPADCRDCEQLILCDLTDGADPYPFMRTVCRDCAGAVVSVLDTELNGAAPYTPTGTVGTCATDCETAAVQTFRLCDLNPAVEPNDEGLRCAVPFLRHFTYGCDGTATFHDTEMDGSTPYTPMEVVDCGDSPPSLREQVWNTVSVAADPSDATGATFIYTVANSENPAQTGTVKMTASKAPDGGCGTSPTAPVWNAGVTFVFEPDATVMALASVLRVDAIDWDPWEDKFIPSGGPSSGGTWPIPDRVESDLGFSNVSATRWHSDAANNNGRFYFSGPPAAVAMGNRNDGGGLACVAPAFGFTTLVPGPPCGIADTCAKQVIERCGCDDTNGDGLGDVQYVELWAIDPCGGDAPAPLGTYLDGDLTQPYTPVAPVECTAAETLPGPLSTGVRAVTGTAVQDIAATFPGAQSVTLTVLADAVNVTMSDGAAVPIPAGITMTWSVAQDADTSLAAASFAGATAAASYLLNWTYR
ncbi:hypothetical protein ACH437_23650 [Streptomyces xinghaiensis]|uniref:hypothetical protein n=1 Tax=Streptomyces xinghaiensis TaxID=1038928 RepID=UPI00379F70F3